MIQITRIAAEIYQCGFTDIAFWRYGGPFALIYSNQLFKITTRHLCYIRAVKQGMGWFHVPRAIQRGLGSIPCDCGSCEKREINWRKHALLSGNAMSLNGRSYHLFGKCLQSWHCEWPIKRLLPWRAELSRTGRPHPTKRRSSTLEVAADDVKRAAESGLPSLPPGHVMRSLGFEVAANESIIPAVQGRIIREVPPTPGSTSSAVIRRQVTLSIDL